mmetsp:Transcript_73808/g.175700  ORF Transcript_73808/g.175700 Transcript_73808/m.175700 type:complete len:507 (+) Transcript_73808:93-1613(+)
MPTPAAALKLKAVVGFSLAAAFTAHFQFEEKHTCGVCRDIADGLPCERYGACHLLNSTSVDEVGCDKFCTVLGGSSEILRRPSSGMWDLRVTKAFGTKDYDLVRISVISNSSTPPIAGFFDYSGQFKYRWTENFLHTGLKKVTPGGESTFNLGEGASPIKVSLPARGAGVAGLLIADPCISAKSGWIGCAFGDKYQTSQRTPELISSFAEDKDTNFWGIIGDNFYDRTGELSKPIFNSISVEAKSKVFVSVPGNHDYWVLGSPLVASHKDQCGNGFMQFYAQDAKSSESILPGNKSAPFDFSVNPDRLILPCKVAALDNFFWYNQVGNIGMVGQSGAFSLDEAKPFMQEACAWLGKQAGLEVALLFGHWDKSGLGASEEMAMPQWYEEMAALPGCSDFHKRGMLKFVMGHTHCNDPHPHGKVGAGFRVAGFGMDGGCGNFGAPVVDTTGNHFRFWYFDMSSDDKYMNVMNCVRKQGWRSCTSMATLWIDQPLQGSSAQAFQEQVIV